MSERPATCPRCGSRLTSGSPLDELCPRCLVLLAVEPREEVAAIDAPGTRFGAYRLLEQVGEGGMGIVWRAQQDHPVRRVVALKVVKPGADSRQVLSRFESERQALAILNHPNIAVVFDAGITPDGRPYFVMEYVPGPPITVFADQHALTIPARLELFVQICDGVAHAHQKGLIHRDLKPSNILVADQDGRAVVKIIDFGVTKAIGSRLAAETMATQIGVLLGTPEYMSPEQAGLMDAAVDTRTDIYSLGLVLYELLVGALPFDSRELRRKAVFEMLRVIREEDPPRLTLRLTSQTDAEIQEIARRRFTEPGRLRRQLQGDLEWITSRALEKDPSRRYASASELRADVRRNLSNEPVVAGPPDLTYRLGKLARKHRTTAIAASVALAALVVSAVVSTALWISADRARRENRDRLKALHVTTGLALASEGEGLKALPWLVRGLQLEEGGPRAEELHRIRIRNVLDGSPFPIRIWQHAGLVGAYLAPDRASLATWERNGTVRVWDSARGESVGPPLQHSAPLVDVRVAGSIVVTGDERGIVRRWDPRTGREMLPALTHAPDLRFVRVSPESNRLLTVDGRGGIRAWALDSGRAVASLQHGAGVTVAEFVGIGRTFAVGDGNGSLLIADSESGAALSRLPHESGVVSVAATPDDHLVTATRNAVIRVWNLSTGTAEFESGVVIASGVNELRVSLDWAFVCGDDGAVLAALGRARSPQRLSAHVNCTSVDMSDDGLLVAMSYRDGAVRTWQAPALPFAPSLPHSGQVLLVRFLTESRRLLSVDSAGVIRVWDVSPASPAPVTHGNLYTWDSIFSPDGRHVAYASGSSAVPYIGVATVHDATTGEAVLPPLRHGANVRSVAFSPNGQLIATASDNATARLWDAATGEPLGEELAVLGGVGDLRFSPDGQRLLVHHLLGLKILPVSLYDVRTGRRIASLPESGHVRSSSFSPDSRHVSTVTRPAGRVQVWRTSDGGEVPAADWGSFEAAAFLSNSAIVMVGPRSIEVRRVDGTRVETNPIGIGGVQGIEVTTDGTSFIVASDDGSAHVFNARGPIKPRFPPWRLPGALSDGALSADNRWFIAASWQRRVRVWSMETGEPVTPERAVALLPLSVSFSPKGSTFQVSGVGARAWELRPDRRSPDVLEGIAQLLSGMELSGTELVPLSVDRLIRLVHDPRIAQTSSPSDERNWRWSAANAQLTRRNWAAAETILAAMARDPEAIWEVHASHGQALAELNRWSAAVHAFELARARRPDSTELIYYEALARAAGGDTNAIDGACRAGIQKFARTRNPDRAHWLASLCVLAAIPADTIRTSVRELARITADVEPDLEHFVTVHAAALLRANDAAHAAALLDDVLKRPVVRDRSAETLLVYALAQRTLGQQSAARQALARFDASPMRATMPWHRRFEAQIWQQALRTPK